jgi:uncharacterized membrane protein YfcA
VLEQLSPEAWVALGLAAALVGFAKTCLGGAASVAVAVFAATLPARESTGALLPLLLVGDVLAVGLYRRHGSGTTLLRLLPGVLPGLALGAWFVAAVDDDVMRLSIGLVLLVMTGIQLAARLRPTPVRPDPTPHPLLSAGVGVLAGFATMTANAGGPVMRLYLILAGLPMLAMLGTGAWFFLAVNLTKVPFSVGVGLVSGSSLAMDALLVPALLLGGLVGARTVSRLGQERFERATLGLGMVAALMLVVEA